MSTFQSTGGISESPLMILKRRTGIRSLKTNFDSAELTALSKSPILIVNQPKNTSRKSGAQSSR